MSHLSVPRRRAVRYVRICQHCAQEIHTREVYMNFFYSLLCFRCFKRNAAPLGWEEERPAHVWQPEPVSRGEW